MHRFQLWLAIVATALACSAGWLVRPLAFQPAAPFDVLGVLWLLMHLPHLIAWGMFLLLAALALYAWGAYLRRRLGPHTLSRSRARWW